MNGKFSRINHTTENNATRHRPAIVNLLPIWSSSAVPMVFTMVQSVISLVQMVSILPVSVRPHATQKQEIGIISGVRSLIKHHAVRESAILKVTIIFLSSNQ